jgi:hypothetical protein
MPTLPKLQEAMTSVDWDPHKLAAASGMSHQVIRRILGGANTREDTAVKLQAALNTERAARGMPAMQLSEEISVTRMTVRTKEEKQADAAKSTGVGRLWGERGPGDPKDILNPPEVSPERALRNYGHRECDPGMGECYSCYRTLEEMNGRGELKGLPVLPPARGLCKLAHGWTHRPDAPGQMVLASSLIIPGEAPDEIVINS